MDDRRETVKEPHSGTGLLTDLLFFLSLCLFVAFHQEFRFLFASTIETMANCDGTCDQWTPLGGGRCAGIKPQKRKE